LNLSSRFENADYQLLERDVMALDFPENSVDAIFMAYGIRNMPDYDACLKNLLRTLKPGGKICFHEFSLNEGKFFRMYWIMLGYGVIIPFSALATGNLTIFKYLVQSVLNFPNPNAFKKMLSENGFENIRIYPQNSWRKFILQTFIAQKPAK
jgi:ubiquinone/menaquinone biosynthesis C-methylase UbiE